MSHGQFCDWLIKFNLCSCPCCYKNTQAGGVISFSAYITLKIQICMVQLWKPSTQWTTSFIMADAGVCKRNCVSACILDVFNEVKVRKKSLERRLKACSLCHTLSVSIAPPSVLWRFLTRSSTQSMLGRSWGFVTMMELRSVWSPSE